MPDTDTAEAFARLPTFAFPTVSRDGGEVALYYDGTGRRELHVVDVETGTREQWSNGEVPRDGSAGLRWAADGDRVFFHADEDGDERYDAYAIDREGVVETVLATEGSVGVQDVGPDGDRLLLGITSDGQPNLHAYDLDGGELTPLTDFDGPGGGGRFSPSGDRISYGVIDPEDYLGRTLYVADADGSDPRALDVGEPDSRSRVADWHPGGDRLLVRDDAGEYVRSGVYDLRTESVTWYGDAEFAERPRFFLPGGDRFVAVRIRPVTTVPVAYDLETGQAREFDVPEGVTWFGRIPSGNYVVNDDRVLLTHTAPRTRPELWVYDLAADDYRVLVPADYGPFSPSDFADVEHVRFRSDGVPETPARAVDHDPSDEYWIDALLWDSGERPSPLVVYPHGGPRARNAKEFHQYTQFLALLGYSVLHVNYRGSTGRGRSFHEELYGDWGGAEAGDVATGLEHVLAEYDRIDENRVAVFGRSYGGYLAYWQLLQYPDLYDAGVADLAESDLPDMHENSVLTGWVEKHLGTPEGNPDLYEERSPTTHADDLDAPLFILHGVNDPRVPVSQARLMREALSDAGYEEGPGGDVEYLELEGEGHGSGDVERTVRRFELLRDFLGRRIGAD
ncbi:S9 family peptidase [Halobacteriales archaeon QS_8_69_26]|nr:MAG: S9 family peptidase [Halobacteriales archaeon QS_8_69_26]